jgi:hypothetical protein
MNGGRLFFLFLFLVAFPAFGGWETRTSAHFQVRYLSESQRQGDAIWPMFEAELARVSGQLHAEPPATITVVFTSDQKSFSSLQGGGVSDWVSGTSYPDRALVYLRPLTGSEVRANSLRAVIAHELSHVVLHHKLAANPSPSAPPAWLDEGLAVYLSAEPLYARAEHLFPLGLSGRYIPFRQLEQHFPDNPETAATAYAQAGDFVNFLYSRFGGDAVNQYLEAMARGEDPDVALKAAFHATLFDLETQWFASVRRTYGLIPALSGGAFLWFLISLLAIVAYLRKRERSKKKLALMDLEERYVAAVNDDSDRDDDDEEEEDEDEEPVRGLH